MFDFLETVDANTLDADITSALAHMHGETTYLYSTNDLSGLTAFTAMKKLPHDRIKLLVLRLLEYYKSCHTKKLVFPATDSDDLNALATYAHLTVEVVLAGLLRANRKYTEAEWITLFGKYDQVYAEVSAGSADYFSLSRLPIGYSVKQLEHYLKSNALTEALRDRVRQTLAWRDFTQATNQYYGNDLTKVKTRLEKLLVGSGAAPVLKLPTTDIGPAVNALVAAIDKHVDAYSHLFLLASEAAGGKPSAAFLKSNNQLLDTISLDQYRRTAHRILEIAVAQKAVTRTYTSQHGTYTQTSHVSTYLHTTNQTFLKGLVWTCHRFSDKTTTDLLTRLAEKCYQKLPGKGPAAGSVGNACLHILGHMKGKDGLGALSRLKLKIRQSGIRKRIDNYLHTGAAKYGVSVEELKEMAVPDFGLANGEKSYAFDDYQLTVALGGKKLTQQWTKPDGSPLKSVPAAVKNSTSLKQRLADVRKELKEMQQVYGAQKQRIDNQLLLDRQWDWAAFQQYYLNHGLVFPITTRLVWSFADGERTANGILLDAAWQTVDGEPIGWLGDTTTVRLWHPIRATEAEIVAWRQRMVALQWQQPTKQAYREIYLMTDAERRTDTYSNRMAAHLLKQHQFSSLAALRGWKYALLGAYDDGREGEVCSRWLPEHQLTAEFWIDELPNTEDAFNETGIWLYVGTDQVKFKDARGQEVRLVDVPPVVFTEIMRDVDLFVGVASVGNDPTWVDHNGAREQYRAYWQDYSFGDLSEIAKTRKTVLAGLLPRLKKLRDRAHIDGKFLVVRGQLRTYKIHIGSGNILMTPDDQYLCIVPARSADKVTGNLFVPFEGDRGLSIVLSKALLLAEDDKVTDPVIVRQIERSSNPGVAE